MKLCERRWTCRSGTPEQTVVRDKATARARAMQRVAK